MVTNEWGAGDRERAEELLLKHEDDEVVLIVLLFRLRIATFKTIICRGVSGRRPVF